MSSGPLCLAVAAEDVKLWSFETLTLNHQFSPHQARITSLSWSLDGSVSLCDCFVNIYKYMTWFSLWFRTCAKNWCV